MMIPLSRGRFAQVDDADVALVHGHRWHVVGRRHLYAETKTNGRQVYMHRLVMGFPSEEVDHINGDTLDNRRSNLRLATYSQQRQNSDGQPRRRKSRYKGVFWWSNPKLSFGGYWMAKVQHHGRQFTKACKSEIEAAHAYNAMTREHFGEFARLNVIEGDA